VSVAEPETAPQPGAAALPSLRLLPAPPCDPPYDDELPATSHLRLVTSGGAVVARTPPVPIVAPLRLLPAPAVPDRPGVPGGGSGTDDGDEPARTRLADLPPARPFAHALVQRLLEVLAGLRPVGQLQRDTSLELFDELTRAVAARPRTAGPRPTRRDVRSLHVQQREDGVAEVCATVRRGGRVTALAFRLEGRSGAWRCTELLGV
jgi:hypothetical protein